MSFKASVTMPPRSAFDNFARESEQRLEHAALIATDGAARDALREIRNAMAAAGLGNLGRALSYGSDAKKNSAVYRRPGGFSASGYVFIRTRNERTRGAIESYTQGAEIAPKKGRYLWIATDEIPAKAGRFRMTPERYRSSGMEARIGPLTFVPSVNGHPLLVIKDGSVAASGAKRRARSRTKSGRLRAGQREKAFIVAFVGIPFTRRAARIDVPAIMLPFQQSLGQRINRELDRK